MATENGSAFPTTGQTGSPAWWSASRASHATRTL